jgi:hypothetical protein
MSNLPFFRFKIHGLHSRKALAASSQAF